MTKLPCTVCKHSVNYVFRDIKISTCFGDIIDNGNISVVLCKHPACNKPNSTQFASAKKSRSWFGKCKGKFFE